MLEALHGKVCCGHRCDVVHVWAELRAVFGRERGYLLWVGGGADAVLEQDDAGQGL